MSHLHNLPLTYFDPKEMTEQTIFNDFLYLVKGHFEGFLPERLLRSTKEAVMFIDDPLVQIVGVTYETLNPVLKYSKTKDDLFFLKQQTLDDYNKEERLFSDIVYPVLHCLSIPSKHILLDPNETLDFLDLQIQNAWNGLNNHYSDSLVQTLLNGDSMITFPVSGTEYYEIPFETPDYGLHYDQPVEKTLDDTINDSTKKKE